MGIRIHCDLSKACEWLEARNRRGGYWKVRPEVLDFMDSRGIPFRSNASLSEQDWSVVFPDEFAKDAMLFKLTWGGK